MARRCPFFLDKIGCKSDRGIEEGQHGDEDDLEDMSAELYNSGHRDRAWQRYRVRAVLSRVTGQVQR